MNQINTRIIKAIPSIYPHGIVFYNIFKTEFSSTEFFILKTPTN